MRVNWAGTAPLQSLEGNSLTAEMHDTSVRRDGSSKRARRGDRRIQTPGSDQAVCRDKKSAIASGARCHDFVKPGGDLHRSMHRKRRIENSFAINKIGAKGLLFAFN